MTKREMFERNEQLSPEFAYLGASCLAAASTRSWSFEGTSRSGITRMTPALTSAARRTSRS